MVRNHFSGVGRITQDLELHEAGESKVLNFSVAIKRFGKDAETDFIDCVAWNGAAENIVRYFKKGDRIGIEGRLQVRSYEAKDGTKRRATEIVIEGFEFIEKRDGNASVVADEDVPY